MPARRVRSILAVCAAAGAAALMPASASAHPEECASSGMTSAPSADWFADWGESYDDCLSDAAVANFDDSDAQLAVGEEAGTDNLRLVSNTPKSPPFEETGDYNSDLAFEDGYAYQGNYDGVQIWDVRNPGRARLASTIHCPGAQNDVTVNDGILVTSTDSVRNNDTCNSTPVPSSSSEYGEATNWEGLKIFDVRNPLRPEYLGSVFTDCGAHTHTVIPERNRLLVYVNSYDISGAKYECKGPHDKISVVEVPRNDPGAARVVNEPVLFPDGGNPGDVDTSQTRGCHDITVYPALDLAAGACTGEGVLMDISDPVNPEVLSNIVDNENFAFWHSATISNDGKQVLFTDELGGGGRPTCNPSVGPNKGADAIYDITDRANPRFLSYWKIPRTQSNTENCVAHNGNVLPVPGRDIMVQSWYQGGVSIIDWTDGENVRELAWHDRGPISDTQLVLGGSWSAYFYNGTIFSSEIQRGFDVFEFDDPAVRRSMRHYSGTLNAQTQEPLRKGARWNRGGGRWNHGGGRWNDGGGRWN